MADYGDDRTGDGEDDTATDLESGHLLPAPVSATNIPPSPPDSLAADDMGEWHVGGQVLSQYEITDVHRHGAMGLVYRARHLGWDTALAVKCPRPNVFRTRTDQERFVQEAETWVALGLHPHICACHYVRTIGGIPRVFAEYVEGGSLRDWINDGRLYQGSMRRVLARVLDIAIQTAWGLEHAHTLGVVHQDVKPANILLEHDGQAKLTDFGLARAYTFHTDPLALPGMSTDAALATMRGMTPAYASPEQTSGEALSRRTDVWSFAVSVLEMFTGEVTWLRGPAAGEALADFRAHGCPAGPLAAMPDGLADLLARCLRWDPAHRPDSMVEVASALTAIYARETGSAYPRRSPTAAELRADELNNRALSLFDLRRDSEADQLFRQALEADPRHPEASYNSGVLRWRSGDITDDALLNDLETTLTSGGEPGRTQHLIDLVQLERGDPGPEITLDVQQRRAPAMCVTPDGEHALTGDDDGAVQVWQLSTGHCLRVLAVHADSEVVSISVDSDGSHVLVAYAEGTVRLWELSTGRCLRKRRRRGLATVFSLEADSRLVLMAGLFDRQGKVRVWRLSDGRRLCTIRTGSEVTSMCVSSGGQYALIGEDGGAVGVWEPSTGRRLHTLTAHTDSVKSISVSSDGQYAVTATGGLQDLTAQVWDLRTGRCVHALEGHTGGITSVCVNPERQFALTGSGDKTVRVWDLSSGRCLRVLTGHANIVESVSLSGANQRIVATMDLAGVVHVWDLSSGRCLRTFAMDRSMGSSVLVTSDGRYVLFSGSGKVEARRVAPAGPSPLQICRPRSATELSAVDSHVDNLIAEAAHAEAEGHLRAALTLLKTARAQPGHERAPKVMEAWRRLAQSSFRASFRTAWLSQTFEGGDNQLTDVCVTPDGRYALSGGHADDAMWVWDLSSGLRVNKLVGHTGTVLSACVALDGRLAVTGGMDGTARVWDLSSYCQVRVLVGHTGAILSVCVTPDGRFAVTASRDETARIWELAAGRCAHVLKGHIGVVGSVCTTPDGQYALTAGRLDGSVRQWDLATGRCVRVPETFPSGLIEAICLTPNGHLLTVRGLPSGAVRVRELSTGRFARDLNAGVTWLQSVCVTPDGRFALTGGTDHTVRLLELSTGRQVGELEGHTAGAHSVCVTPDGQHALVACSDGAIRVWEIDWELEARDPS